MATETQRHRAEREKRISRQSLSLSFSVAAVALWHRMANQFGELKQKKWPQRHRDTEQKEKRGFLDNLFPSLSPWLCGSVA
jgi:hypothetical protein